MGKSLYIAEKPSVAQEFARVLGIHGVRGNGFLESDEAVVTWCVGHLVTMSYPEVYDPALKRWSLDTLPFIPEQFRYEVIGSVSQQFETVKRLLTRPDVETIYVCTDSGREGEYIYRLVEQMAGVQGKKRLRVWIDSQTEEEIRKGIREAKDLSAYDNLAASAYLRAKEDYLMGINFSRLLTLKYGSLLASCLKRERSVISVGRVMTCVLGMVVRREREIREFVKTPFYRIVADVELPGEKGPVGFPAEWKAVEGSRYFAHPALYKENGFRKKEDAESLIRLLTEPDQAPWPLTLLKKEKKTEKKNAPLLFNLAELQNVCSRTMKISPDETLKITQELYEKKLVTYPRTDARVLSTAVAKEIDKNLKGLMNVSFAAPFAGEILQNRMYAGIAKSKYTNDKQITDHYAIIPTGQGLSALQGLSARHARVYDLIVRRFLSIFYPPAVFEKTSLELERRGEHFFASFRLMTDPGFMKVTGEWKEKKGEGEEEENMKLSPELSGLLAGLRKGASLPAAGFSVREGETSPPKRYTSGSMILAMENAGQLIEDEELRAQIKGSGIGTSATRAEILKKLVSNGYLDLNKKTQTITPALAGELVYEAVFCSIRSLLNPDLTASWEKGLAQVSEGALTEEDYMEKLKGYIIRRTSAVMGRNDASFIREAYGKIRPFYKA